MEMIVADGNEHVGLRLGEFFPHHSDAFQHFFASRRPLGLLEEPRHEGVVGDANDRDDLGHGLPPVSHSHALTTTKLQL